MNVNQRNQILINIDALVNLTDFDELCQACYQNHLLSATMIKNICAIDSRNTSQELCNEYMTKKELHKKLFTKITKRGPDAFEKLRRIFVALQYFEALNILFSDESTISISRSKQLDVPSTRQGETVKTNCNNDIELEKPVSFIRTNNNSNIHLHEYEGPIIPKKNISVRMAKRIIIDPRIGTYLMESKNNRGIFFMVSSCEEREEQDEDVFSLLCLFKQLGFKLYAYRNIKLKTFLDLLEELLKSDKIFNIECFVLAVKAGYRTINGVQWITFIDGSVLKVEQIQRYFYHQNCKELMGKPKIFIYPYSDILNKGVIINEKSIRIDGLHQGDGFKNVALLSDVINCYATSNVFMDDRDNESYSRYIKLLVDVIAQHACDTHFENMLKIIQAHVATLSTVGGDLQMAIYDNISFNKILYFNPGLNLS